MSNNKLVPLPRLASPTEKSWICHGCSISLRLDSQKKEKKIYRTGLNLHSKIVKAETDEDC